MVSRTDVCYKNTCARFYGQNADIIAGAIFVAIIAFALSHIAKIK